VLVDLRNIYRVEEMGESGFTYVSIGRPSVHPDQDDELSTFEGARQKYFAQVE
jgi:hypothetical protein